MRDRNYLAFFCEFYNRNVLWKENIFLPLRLIINKRVPKGVKHVQRVFANLQSVFNINRARFVYSNALL